MDQALPVLIGLVTGVLYNEHIYQQSVRFPRRVLILSFWVRFSLLSLVTIGVALAFGGAGLVAFTVSTLAARILHTLFRSFVAVRY